MTPEEWRSIFPKKHLGPLEQRPEVVALAAHFGIVLPSSVENLLVALAGTSPSPLGDVAIDLAHLRRSNELVRENALEFDSQPWPNSLFVIASRIGLEVAIVDVSVPDHDPEVLLMSTLDDDSTKTSAGRLEAWIRSIAATNPWGRRS